MTLHDLVALREWVDERVDLQINRFYRKHIYPRTDDMNVKQLREVDDRFINRLLGTHDPTCPSRRTPN